MENTVNLADQEECRPSVLRRPLEPPPEVKQNAYNVRSVGGRSHIVPDGTLRTQNMPNAGAYENSSISMSNSNNEFNHSDRLTEFVSSMSISSNAAVPKSTLSAEAPEFIPRFSMPEYSQQESNLPTATHVQVPDGNISVNVAEQNVPHIFQPQLKYISHPVILQVNDLVYSLAWKPHRFDQIASQLTSILSWKVKELDLMKEVISVIFEEGVGEQNFRYSGGRLCQHLSKHVTQSYDGPSFKALLLQKCQEEFYWRDYYLQVNPERLCGFTLFLSEIYKKLLTPCGQPLEKLTDAICILLMTLMSSPTASNLKCVSNLLKATGSLLESKNSEEFEKVMCRLKDVVMPSKLPGNVRSLLLSVIELRASNWGRKVEDETPSQSDPDSDAPPPMGTVYYGPGGVIQSIEEENDDSASDTDETYIRYRDQERNSEIFDEDMALGYEEFLKEQAHEGYLNERQQYQQNDTSSPYSKQF